VADARERIPPATRQRRAGAGRPRSRPRDNARDPRDDIVAVASQLFARKGVASTRMSEIADGAGLQQSSIYYYFRNKQEILRDIVVNVNRIPLAFLARINAEGGSAGVRLFRLVRFDTQTLCSFPYDINEIHRLSAEQPDAFTEYWTERQALNDGVEQLVGDGIDHNEFRPVDPRLTALTILANDEGVQNWYRPVGDRRLRGRDRGAGGDYEPTEIGSFLASFTLQGLLQERRRLTAIIRKADELDY
jgi:AcrR family transcriptional regulator